MRSNIPRAIISFGVAAEKYILPFVYLFFAFQELEAIYSLLVEGWSMPSAGASLKLGIFTRHALLFMLQLFIGSMLLIASEPVTQPGSVREIVVPLTASFFFLTYNAMSLLPYGLQRSLFAPPLQTALAFPAILCGIIGYAIAIWGVMFLGRSFGILVSVRQVVLGGPYRYVRHPIYLGYICVWLGLILAYGSAATLILVPIHLLLIIWRARLEESHLCKADPRYREYMSRTGFLLPNLPL